MGDNSAATQAKSGSEERHAEAGAAFPASSVLLRSECQIEMYRTVSHSRDFVRPISHRSTDPRLTAVV